MIVDSVSFVVGGRYRPLARRVDTRGGPSPDDDDCCPATAAIASPPAPMNRCWRPRRCRGRRGSPGSAGAACEAGGSAEPDDGERTFFVVCSSGRLAREGDRDGGVFEGEAGAVLVAGPVDGRSGELGGGVAELVGEGGELGDLALGVGELVVTRSWKRFWTGPQRSPSQMPTRSVISSSEQPSCLARAMNASRARASSS